MNVAITVWENRISPVFDSGRTLMIAEIKDQAVRNTLYLNFDFDRPYELLRTLRAENVELIICGAISEEHTNMFLSAGFRLISFVAGSVVEVVEAFIRDDLQREEFKMPGCGKKICCRGKIRSGHEIGKFNETGNRVRGWQKSFSSIISKKMEEANGGVKSSKRSGR